MAGHVCQYIVYPIFCYCYVSRALRLIILFKRAEKGLYFADNEMESRSTDNSTMAILKQSREEFEYEKSFNSSVVHQPKSKNLVTRVYYWLLFRLETEKDYFILTLIFTALPAASVVYTVATQDLTLFPVVNFSHCLPQDPKEADDVDFGIPIMIDVVARSVDCYVITTIFLQLLHIRRDFR